MDNRIPISKLQKFTDLMIAFGKVERVYNYPGTERRENDQEHSYLLAMTAWYLVNSNKLALDIGKIFKYALAHDVVEVFAGDTDFYSADEEFVASKPDREAAAAERIQAAHPEFAELHEYSNGYVRREDAESRFVYALDKILPILLIYADGGRSWRDHGVTLQMLIARKTPKVALSPEVQPYFDDLVQILKGEEKRIFG